MRSFFLVSFLFLLSKIVLAQTSENRAEPKEAVLIIGSELSSSDESKKRMEDIAEILKENNYVVHRFYSPRDNWNKIKKAALNASIFIYNGHGTELGLDGGYGGLVLNDFISAQTIVDELEFKNNPLVIFQSVCGGAGSSAADYYEIDLEEAKERVIGSAKPFFLAGASAYYANNYFGGVDDFLKEFLSGKSLVESFELSCFMWTQIEVIEALNDSDLNRDLNFGIAYSVEDEDDESVKKKNKKKHLEPKDYNIAFIGNPELTVSQIQLLSNK